MHKRRMHMEERSSGILLHISALPGKYGIGDFGENAYQFVDFLSASRTQYWQILPLGITSYGDSPYQSFSAFAGNPYFIDLDRIVESGWLRKSEITKTDLGEDDDTVDYAKLYKGKMALLDTAFQRAYPDVKSELESMMERHSDWLPDFALFMAIKRTHDNAAWTEWPEHYRLRDEKTLQHFYGRHEAEIMFWVFTQYLFFEHWHDLKEYANGKGIKIIGDIPIYVAADSVDVWSRPDLYKLDENLHPSVVAGVPPDMMSDTGQLWGNPIYDWKKMKEEGYHWWIRRVEESFELYDTVRIDHFRGFEAYWEVPAQDETAENGRWVKGPGLPLFEAIREKLGEKDILAEDLGFLTEEVYELIASTGYPGMKVLQFGFGGKESEYLPHNYTRHTIAYTGNHDTQTTKGWLASADSDTFNKVQAYLNLTEAEGHVNGCIRGVFASSSNLAIIPVQDLLGLGDAARFNVPSTIGGNWEWRLTPGSLTKAHKDYLKNINERYGRSL
ncbi:4-alpha-glucanotransferase [Salinicoccus jeotgali]